MFVDKDETIVTLNIYNNKGKMKILIVIAGNKNLMVIKVNNHQFLVYVIVTYDWILFLF